MSVAAIILAAGFSSRMGVLKPLLPVGDVTAVRRCIDIARIAGAGTVVVVTGHRGDEVAEEALCAGGDIIIAHNARHSDGMFSSVICGAGALPPDSGGFFLFPVDYCAVRPDTLKTQLRAFLDADGASAVFSFRDGHRGHPPLIPAGLKEKIIEYGGEGGLKGFIAPYPQIYVNTDDPGAYMDMDMPGDYAALLEHLGLPTYPDEAACRALIAKYETPRDITEHGEQVAGLAIKIARLMKGARLDLALLRSACLLHDIARRERGHAEAGAKLLLREGYPAAARLVEVHMDGPSVPVTGADDIDEAALLFLADKLSRRGKTVTIERTIKELPGRFPPDSEALRAAAARMARADELLRILFETYGFGYEDIIERADGRAKPSLR